ncbi:hypothetical protein OG762_19215 [Streptomyces sp. NBC_01136]|uniref:hypothetical protein n=1 Tax=unclassified Streptomyces TaxID=2593676 RepID=UPI00324CF663|nr:hypothetical protein OG762_19215 [Streptomyces sp. NBC_01136]
MSITQQYLPDTYRARQHGEQASPAPGAYDWQVARELCGYRQFRAVMAGRPAHGRMRQALGRWLHGRRPHPSR